MTRGEAVKVLEEVYAQLYDPITGKKKALSAKKYNELYELYEEQEKKYEFELGEEKRPEYGENELNDLLDDICAALA